MADIVELLGAMKDFHLNTKNCRDSELLTKPTDKNAEKPGISQLSKNLLPGFQSKIHQQQSKIADLQCENRNLRNQLEVIRNILDDTEGFCANIIKHHTKTNENPVFKRWQRDALCLSRKVFYALHMPEVLLRQDDDDGNDVGAGKLTKKKTKAPIVNLENCFRHGSAYEDPSDSGVGANSYESFKAILDEQDRIDGLDKKLPKKRVRNKKNRDIKATDNGSHDEKLYDEETNNKESRNKDDCPKVAYYVENRKKDLHGIGTDNKGAPSVGDPDKRKHDNKTFGNEVSQDLGFFGKAPFKRATVNTGPYSKERRMKGGRPIIYHEEADFPRNVCLSKCFKKKFKYQA